MRHFQTNPWGFFHTACLYMIVVMTLIMVQYGMAHEADVRVGLPQIGVSSEGRIATIVNATNGALASIENDMKRITLP